jgi:hypothetical protein
MSELRVTLLSDGPSDRALIPILVWLLRQNGVRSPIQPSWADLRQLPSPPSDLPDRILTAIDLYPCDALFVHRDGERQPYAVRQSQIQKGVEAAKALAPVSPFPMAIPVIPVRMQEAWLLVDVEAIRRAAGNPNGRVPLSLPSVSSLEDIPNPKDILTGLLETATERGQRRLRKFNPGQARLRLADLITSYAPLRSLRAFKQLESVIQQTIHDCGWS